MYPLSRVPWAPFGAGGRRWKGDKDMDQLIGTLAREFQVRPEHAQAVVELLDEGNTVPFIARYRKERHGGMDDQTIRELADRLRDAGLPVLDIHDLERRAERYTGKLPPLKPGGRTVGLVYWRDGTVLDEIKMNDEL